MSFNNLLKLLGVNSRGKGIWVRLNNGIASTNISLIDVCESCVNLLGDYLIVFNIF